MEVCVVLDAEVVSLGVTEVDLAVPVEVVVVPDVVCVVLRS